MDKTSVIQKAYHVSHLLEDDRQFPNNPKLPLLIYKGAFFLRPDDKPEAIIEIFKNNDWTNAWVNGVFDYHHYHSTTHEVLGVFCGRANVQFGGPEGICVKLQRGDVVLIPAGVAHKNLDASKDFLCVGAYPGGKDYDIKYGMAEERAQADENINKVPVPEKDPVYGNDEGLKEFWK